MTDYATHKRKRLLRKYRAGTLTPAERDELAALHARALFRHWKSPQERAEWLRSRYAWERGHRQGIADANQRLPEPIDEMELVLR